MNKPSKTFAFKTTAIALVAATSLTLSAPAFADGRHHGNGNNGWAWSGQQYHGDNVYHGGNRYRHNDYNRHNRRDNNDDALAAVAIVGGVLLGAALLSSASQPSYSQPPQAVYAPAPAYGQSYGYDQAPIQAVPSSDVYQAQSGQYCREYQSQANIGGQMQYGYGTACLQPDGSWRVAN